MASSKTIVRLNTKELQKQLLQELSMIQSRQLIAYAKAKIVEIGNRIMSYHSANGMDRTGNLINSLCWGVSYQGSLVEGGFFRDELLRNKGIAKTSDSYLHEWFSGDEKYLEMVHGHQLADEYIHSYGNNGALGWKVFFAILAPYWGYWEKGFTQVHRLGSRGGFMGSTFQRFAVMTEFYDQVKADLKPARTRLRVSVRKYHHDKLVNKWRKRSEGRYDFAKD